MSIAIIYWSGTGNTEAMAKAVQKGAGAGAQLFSVADFDVTKADRYDAFALGCPAWAARNWKARNLSPFLKS